MLEKGRVKLGFSGLNFCVEVIYIGSVCIFSFFEVLGCNGGGIEEDEVQEVFHPSVGVGGYCFSDHGIDIGDKGGILVDGVFDLRIPFAGFEFVKVYGECDNLMICVYGGGQSK